MRARIGQIVLYGIGTDHGETVYRPCIVVAVFGEDSINGQVLTDGENDRRHLPQLEIPEGGRKKHEEPPAVPASLWVTSVPYSASGGVQTWHVPGDQPGETRRGDLQAQQSP